MTASDTPRLYIGNRNYSSWSLRPWLALKWARIEFEEMLIDLDQPGYGAGRIPAILAISPAGRVPVLQLRAHGGTYSVWDSLAICEWAAEHTRAAPLWPSDAVLRAQARAVVAEMHSGFSALRRDLPMNLRRRCRASGYPEETRADVARIDAMWSEMREQHRADGDHLFGARSIADAFYTPVATRFRTYGITLSPESQRYADTLLQDAAFLEWERAVLAEPAKPFARANIDSIYA